MPHPSQDPGYTGAEDQVKTASRRLGEAGLPVDSLIDAARWLESFSRGESGYGGLGEAAAPWLKQTALEILGAADRLARELRAHP